MYQPGGSSIKPSCAPLDPATYIRLDKSIELKELAKLNKADVNITRHNGYLKNAIPVLELSMMNKIKR